MARSLPSGRYVIIPDLQAPYHDQRALDNVCTWITRRQFDGMLNVLMDMTKASYLKSGGGNWRQAVAVATIDGSAVDVTLRLLHNGKVLG